VIVGVVSYIMLGRGWFLRDKRDNLQNSNTGAEFIGSWV